MRVAPNTPAAEHSLDREEVIVAIAGRAVARFGDEQHEVVAGDGVLIPAHQRFSLANPYDAPFEGVAVLPVGGRADMGGGESFLPPWAA